MAKALSTPMMILGGAILYGGTTYSTYWYAAAHKTPDEKKAGLLSSATATPGSCAFDSLADRYDTTVGSEEMAMGYGLMRWWMLRQAQGDVLEISAGTGRNLSHYSLSSIRSLTLTDLSQPMLQVAEDKYFDELKLGDSNPGTKITFCVSDAHCMAADEAAGRQPRVQSLVQARRLQELRAAAIARAEALETARASKTSSFRDTHPRSATPATPAAPGAPAASSEGSSGDNEDSNSNSNSSFSSFSKIFRFSPSPSVTAEESGAAPPLTPPSSSQPLLKPESPPPSPAPAWSWWKQKQAPSELEMAPAPAPARSWWKQKQAPSEVEIESAPAPARSWWKRKLPEPEIEIKKEEEEMSEPKKLKPLTGGFGNIGNIFRVLTGTLPSKEEAAAAAEAAEAASTSAPSATSAFTATSPSATPSAKGLKPSQPDACTACDYSERCAKGMSEGGLLLSRFPERSFDTIVDTFGLCSHDNPVQVLREVSRVCKKDGTIILLEHGRAHYNWLNKKLDDGADKHHCEWGCRWNRDMMQIIEEAGLRVESVSRWHFGTTYMIVAKPAL